MQVHAGIPRQYTGQFAVHSRPGTTDLASQKFLQGPKQVIGSLLALDIDRLTCRRTLGVTPILADGSTIRRLSIVPATWALNHHSIHVISHVLVSLLVACLCQALTASSSCEPAELHIFLLDVKKNVEHRAFAHDGQVSRADCVLLDSV